MLLPGLNILVHVRRVCNLLQKELKGLQKIFVKPLIPRFHNLHFSNTLVDHIRVDQELVTENQFFNYLTVVSR